MWTELRGCSALCKTADGAINPCIVPLLIYLASNVITAQGFEHVFRTEEVMKKRTRPEAQQSLNSNQETIEELH